MCSQVGPASAKPVNRRRLQTGQDGSARLKIAELEALLGRVDEPRHDPGSHVELLDREDLAGGQTGDPMAEGDPRAEIRRVPRRLLMDQHLDLGRGDANEEIAIDHRQLRGQRAAVQVPDGDAKIHSQQPSQLRRSTIDVRVLARLLVPLASAVYGEHAFQETAGFFGDRGFRVAALT